MPSSRPGESAVKDLQSSPPSSSYLNPPQMTAPTSQSLRFTSIGLPGVSKVIGRGSKFFIGLIDESKILKNPRIAGDSTSIEVKAQLLAVLGSHPRIINSYGPNEHGLLLQYAPNGNLSGYIALNPGVSLSQKQLWYKQAAEAVSYIHQKGVIHCDISPRNFLLDDKLDILLADFQGMLKSPQGETLLDGFAREV